MGDRRTTGSTAQTSVPVEPSGPRVRPRPSAVSTWQRLGDPHCWRREMVIGLVVLVALVVLCWLAATTFRVAIERHDPSVDHDLPSVLLRLACRRLPEDRNEWGRALGAELAAIDGRSARWSFMLGG